MSRNEDHVNAIDLKLGKLADKIPGGEPVLESALARAQQAAEMVSAAVEVDPTLLDYDRSRDLDVCVEILRQLKPLARLLDTGTRPSDRCLVLTGGVRADR